MKKIISVFRFYEWLYLFLCFSLVIVFGVIYAGKPIEIISTCFGLIAAMLNMKMRKECFFFYAVYVALYGSMAFLNRQMGEGILNLCYNLPLYLITIFNLYFSSSKKRKDEPFRIRILSLKGWGIALAIIISGTIGYGYLLSALNSSLPFMNALATCVSVIASFLAARTTREQWFFWLGYSAVLIYIWCWNFISTGSSGLVYLILNICYIGINNYGYVSWIRRSKRDLSLSESDE